MNLSAHPSAGRTTIPVRIDAECTGSPWEIGFQHGQALRDKLRLIPILLHKLEAFRLQQPGWMPFPVYRWLAVRKATKMLSGPLRSQYPDMLQRLEGMSRGSGTHLSLLLLCKVLRPLL